MSNPFKRSAAPFVDWTLRNGRALWIVALILAVPAVWRTGWLYAHLKSDLEELLPADAPSVRGLQELKGRLGGQQYLGVVVDSGVKENIPAAERFLDDLAVRVRAYPSGLVASVKVGRDEERRFLEEHAALYMDLEDLSVIHSRVKARHQYEVAQATGTELEGAEPPPVDLSDIEKKYRDKLGGGSALVSRPRFTDPDRHLSVLLLELGNFSTGSGSGAKLIERVQSDVGALGGVNAYAQGMRLGYAGDAATNAEELSALVTDLSISSVLVALLVALVIILYYRWWRSILVVLPPLLLATAFSFALASLPPFGISAVNSNTAFLGSIIVGNGINFGLILLARYVEERRRGVAVRSSLIEAVAGARGGTMAAAAAAGIAYAALGVTEFRGFRQFGVIGGLGMAFAWVLSFLLMPSLIAWLDRNESTRPKAKDERARFSFWMTRAIAKGPVLVLAATVLFTSVAAIEVSRFRTGDLESDFSKLRRRDTWTRGEGYWGARMNEVLGVYLTPMVMLSDTRDGARSLASALRERLSSEPFAGRIERIITVEDVVPTLQNEKIEVLAAIKKELTPKMRAGMTPEQRAQVARLLPENLEQIALNDVPRSFTLGLRELDGSAGKTVLIFPILGSWTWDGEQMRHVVEALRGVASATSMSLANASALEGAAVRPARLAGALPLSSDIVEAIAVDGPLASMLALLGVIAVVGILLEKKRALLVAGALVTGVLWLAALSRILHVRINFANFIAFPITFGIGVDYAVNVISRYVQDGSKDILAAVRSTGSAVALCSLTTIIGYSSLLMAQNQALFNFGVLAVLGELSCLSVALVSLPALVRLQERRRVVQARAASVAGRRSRAGGTATGPTTRATAA